MIQFCPHCHEAFTNVVAKDMHILQLHHLSLPRTDPHLETLSEMPSDPGNFSGPLGEGAHIIEPSRFLAEEPEEFDFHDHVGMAYWRRGLVRYRDGFARMEDVEDLRRLDEGRDSIEHRRILRNGQTDDEGSVQEERGEDEEEYGSTYQSKEQPEGGDVEHISTYENHWREDFKHDDGQEAEQASEQDEAEPERETNENQAGKAEQEEEETMWQRGLVRYGGDWMSVKEVEELDVEEEERKIFSSWYRENEQQKRMHLLERFEHENLCDEDAKELQILEEEMEGEDEWL